MVLVAQRLFWPTAGRRVQAIRTPGEELADLGMTLAACETDEAFTIAVTKMDGTRDETVARTSLAAHWNPGSDVAHSPSEMSMKLPVGWAQ